MPMPPPTEPRPATVRVRIAVAVDATGAWAAFGASDYQLDDCGAVLWDHQMDDALSADRCYYWITADVPLPVAAGIEGRVTDG